MLKMGNTTKELALKHARCPVKQQCVIMLVSSRHWEPRDCRLIRVREELLVSPHSRTSRKKLKSNHSQDKSFWRNVSREMFQALHSSGAIGVRKAFGATQACKIERLELSSRETISMHVRNRSTKAFFS